VPPDVKERGKMPTREKRPVVPNSLQGTKVKGGLAYKKGREERPVCPKKSKRTLEQLEF